MNDNTKNTSPRLQRSFIRDQILTEVADERTYQEGKWGNEADDEINTPNDFVTFISAYATKWFPGGFFPITPDATNNFRTSMIKTAAIAVAAVESIDRQRMEAGHTHYEQEVLNV